MRRRAIYSVRRAIEGESGREAYNLPFSRPRNPYVGALLTGREYDTAGLTGGVLKEDGGYAFHVPLAACSQDLTPYAHRFQIRS